MSLFEIDFNTLARKLPFAIADITKIEYGLTYVSNGGRPYPYFSCYRNDDKVELAAYRTKWRAVTAFARYGAARVPDSAGIYQYFNEQGTTIGTGFERFNLTLKNNYKVNDNFNVGISIFGTQSEKKSFVTDADASINPANYSRNGD